MGEDLSYCCCCCLRADPAWWHEEPKQGTALSLEISSGSSKEKITCWQSDSGESYFFLPSYGELDEARFRVSGKGTLALTARC